MSEFPSKSPNPSFSEDYSSSNPPTPVSTPTLDRLRARVRDSQRSVVERRKSLDSVTDELGAEIISELAEVELEKDPYAIQEENRLLKTQLQMAQLDRKKLQEELTQVKSELATNLLKQQVSTSTEPGEKTSEDLSLLTEETAGGATDSSKTKLLDSVIQKLQKKVKVLQREKAMLAATGVSAVEQLQDEINFLKTENKEFAKVGETVVRKLRLKVATLEKVLSSQMIFHQQSQKKIKELQQHVLSLESIEEESNATEELHEKEKHDEISSLRTEVNKLRLEMQLSKEVNESVESPYGRDSKEGVPLVGNSLPESEDISWNEVDSEKEVNKAEPVADDISAFKPQGFRQKGWLPPISSFKDIRLRLTNETTGRFKDLVVAVTTDLTLYEAVYNHASVKSAHVRKWPNPKADEVKNKRAEIICVVLDEEGNDIRRFTIQELKELSTRDFVELAPVPRDLIKAVLRCEKTTTEKVRELEAQVFDLESENKELRNSLNIVARDLASSVALHAMLKADLEQSRKTIDQLSIANLSNR